MSSVKDHYHRLPANWTVDMRSEWSVDAVDVGRVVDEVPCWHGLSKGVAVAEVT